MSIEEIDLPEEGLNEETENQEITEEATVETAPGKFDRLLGEHSRKFKLSGMFKDWFLDYSSYVILYRAVPHIVDGMKPVQRRVLHAMWRIDDGRYTKVANIVGQAMQFHPHGDQSILGALVQLGQKNYLVDCQGNWGNILTGDSNAAPRYIEARLTKFAKEVVFNPKTNKAEWRYVDIIHSNSTHHVVRGHKEKDVQLFEGEAIITSGNLNLADGSDVEIRAN